LIRKMKDTFVWLKNKKALTLRIKSNESQSELDPVHK
jgi:hypothetical protein